MTTSDHVGWDYSAQVVRDGGSALLGMVFAIYLMPADPAEHDPFRAA
ncbi:MAG: hypothetical protein ABIQ15_16890 [Nocardioides sp.]